MPAPSARFRRQGLVSVEALDKELTELGFDDVIKNADQYEEELGRVVSEELGLAPPAH